MLYLITALQVEAKPIIKKLNLKLKNNSGFVWPLYFDLDEKICLCVTGVGPISSGAAVSSLLTLYPPSVDSMLFNIGTCAGDKEAVGDLLIANKLVDDTTKRTYYPDLLFKIPDNFAQVELRSSAVSVQETDGFYDMEAAFVYQAAAYFMRPDQMVFIKMVSDSGTQNLNKNQLKNMLIETIEKNIGDIIEFIDSFLTADKLNFDYISRINDNLSPIETGLDFQTYEKLLKDLHCSTTMQYQLDQLLKYGASLGLDLNMLIQDLYHKELVPVDSKKEGLKALDYLKKNIIS